MPALAAAAGTPSFCRKVMKSLICWSVTWRPGTDELPLKGSNLAAPSDRDHRSAAPEAEADERRRWTTSVRPYGPPCVAHRRQILILIDARLRIASPEL